MAILLTGLRLPLRVLGVGVLLALSACSGVETHSAKHLLVLEMTSEDCSHCQPVHFIVQDLRDRYKKRVQFQTLNVTNDADKHYAVMAARSLNAEMYVKNHLDTPALVAIIDTRSGEAVAEIPPGMPEGRYEEALKHAIETTHVDKTQDSQQAPSE